MAGCSIAQFIFSYKTSKLQQLWPYLRKSRIHSLAQVAVKEIRIPVKFGHIAAKLWGSSDKRPILALHGWLDNAGTWDPLIPMIIKNRSILAIDFPGHGQSTAFPLGMTYSLWELPQYILHIKEYFKWDRISILGHSMGAIAALRFACIYNEDIDFLITIDGLAYGTYNFNSLADKYPAVMHKALVAQTLVEQEPPAYTMDEIKEKWHLGSKKSVLLENAQYLIKRGAIQSKKDPTKYCFSRDIRLKYVLFHPDNKAFLEVLFKRLKCPILYVKAKDSPLSSNQFAAEMCEYIQTNNGKFSQKTVPGTHHVHLNNPETVAPLILDFLKEHNV